MGWVFLPSQLNLDKPSQAGSETCLLGESRSCQIDNITIRTNNALQWCNHLQSANLPFCKQTNEIYWVTPKRQKKVEDGETEGRVETLR